MTDYRGRKGSYIGTLEGRFYPQDFRVEDVKLEDLIMGLATELRFAGFTKNGLITVADHSIAVMMAAEREWDDPGVSLYALLHDASEAYLRDIARPIKADLASYQALEACVQQTILQSFGIFHVDQRVKEVVKRADNALLWLEAEYFDAFDPEAELTYMERPDFTIHEVLPWASSLLTKTVNFDHVADTYKMMLDSAVERFNEQ